MKTLEAWECLARSREIVKKKGKNYEKIHRGRKNLYTGICWRAMGSWAIEKEIQLQRRRAGTPNPIQMYG